MHASCCDPTRFAFVIFHVVSSILIPPSSCGCPAGAPQAGVAMRSGRDVGVIRAVTDAVHHGEGTAGSPAVHPLAPVEPSAALAVLAFASMDCHPLPPPTLLRLLHTLLASPSWPCPRCTRATGIAPELHVHFPRTMSAGSDGDDDDDPELGGMGTVRSSLSFGPDDAPGSRERYRWLLWAAVHRRDTSGRTPLYHAALHNHGRCLGTLLALGADASLANVEGRTALHIAVKNAALYDGSRCMHEMVEAAAGDPQIAAGLSWAARDKDGMTPMHLLCWHGCGGAVVARRALVNADWAVRHACCDGHAAKADCDAADFRCRTRLQMEAALGERTARAGTRPLDLLVAASSDLAAMLLDLLTERLRPWAL